MALSGQRVGRAVLELSIDGGAFVRGAGDAKAVMRDLGRNIAQTQRDIQKQAFTLSGRDQIADASKLATAVERIGGVSRLTAAEKAKVNAQLKEAIAKYQVLGQQAPAAMIATERATRGAGTATDWMTAKMTALGAAAGTFASNAAMRAIGTLVSMGREAFASAGRLVDLSAQTGLTTTTLQRMDAVAGQTGTTMDALSNAAFKLNTRISGGGDSVRAALAALGLDFEKIRQQRIDEQFETTIDAMGRMHDSTKRNEAAVELFGDRLAKTAIGAARDWRAISDAAVIASDAQLRALEAAGDRLDKFSKDSKATMQGMMADVLFAADELGKLSLGQLLFQGAASLNPQNFARMLAARGQARAMVEAAQEESAMAATPTPVAEIVDYVKALESARVELKNLDAAERRQIEAAKDLGVDTEVLIDMLVRFGVSSKNAEGALRLLSESTKSSGKAAKSTADEWQQMLDRFNGSQQRTLSANLARAIGSGQIELAKLTDEAQQAITKALEEGAAAWQRWGGIVPLEIDRAIKAVNKLKTSPLTIINNLQPNLTQAPTPEDAIRQLEELEAPDRVWREYMNFVGERMREDAAARMRAQQEARDRRLQPLRDLHAALTGAASANLFSLVTGIGTGADAQAKQRAKDAREDYERLAASGRASAEEITRAFRTMRQAEEAAQDKFSDRFRAWLGGLKGSFLSWINDALGAWTRNFLGGMLRSLLASRLGQALTGWLSGLIPGLGGAAAAAAGVGAGAAAAIPGAAAAPSVAALLGAPPAGAAAGGSGAAAGAGLGLAGGLGIGAAAGLAAWALLDPGTRRGRLIMDAWRRGAPTIEETGEPTPDRLGRIEKDLFLAILNRNTAGSNVARPFTPAPLATPALDRALSLPVYNSTQEMGMATLQRLQAAGGAERLTVPGRPVNLNVTINALDGADVERVWRQKIVPQFRFALKTDQDGVATATRDAALR